MEAFTSPISAATSGTSEMGRPMPHFGRTYERERSLSLVELITWLQLTTIVLEEAGVLSPCRGGRSPEFKAFLSAHVHRP